MIEHKKCRLPAGARFVRGVDDGRVQRRATGQPMHAFLTEDAKDPTALIIWIPDCACVGNPKCPRVKAFTLANKLPYDSASVRIWPPPRRR